MMKQLFYISIFSFLLVACGTSSNKKSSKTITEETVQVKDDTLEDDEIEIIERDHYNPSATILSDLIHTKLEVSFNWKKSQLDGVAEITLSPHFYPTNKLKLDAKSMDIHSVHLGDKPLKFNYKDNAFLTINLDREYKRNEEYTVIIKYTAKPEEKEQGGSSAISNDKGLYFINPTGEEPNKMPQIWTQGETEASSVWFPTIDRPNQKMTQEIFMTVDDKYVTLSNGRLVSSTKNDDGTRTDHWKQDLPHVPYLAAMAVGEFKVVKDSFIKSDGTVIPVHYYVEPEWEEHARAIFGETPEMIAFFSDLLGVGFPWDKYHQVVVRDYVSGAMENTGAVVFGDFVYKTQRELIDGNSHSIIAHELFHHWFGDLVTCESWSNLPLNESFANYSQFLWDEYYYGLDQAEYLAEKEAQGYYQMAQQMGHHDMIWFDYDEKEDMFDAHSYNKGGRILHMLRNYVGDEAFFESLKYYLTTHEYKPVEMHHLRLAFEEVTGEDLNWFFNQWFFASHHPDLNVEMEMDSVKNNVLLTITQEQDLEKAPLYKLPMKIAVFDKKGKTSHEVVIDKNINEFTFAYSDELHNIIVDEDRVLLGSIDFKKPNEYYLHQFYNAPKFKDREEGIKYGSRVRNEAGEQLIFDALSDDFWYIRELGIGKLKKLKRTRSDKVFDYAVKSAQQDKHPRVRASALSFLANEFFEDGYESKTRSALKQALTSDSSYFVVSKAMNGLTKGTEKDIKIAIEMAETMKNEPSSVLKAQVAQIFANYGGPEKLDYFTENLRKGNVSGYEAIGVIGNFTSLLRKQPVEKQEEYLPFYEEMSQTGGLYVNAVLPMNLMMLQRSSESKIDDLTEELVEYEKADNSEKANIIRFEIEKTQDFVEKVSALLMKISG